MWAWIAIAAMLEGGPPAGDGLLVSPDLIEIAEGQPWADVVVRNAGAELVARAEGCAP